MQAEQNLSDSALSTDIGRRSADHARTELQRFLKHRSQTIFLNEEERHGQDFQVPAWKCFTYGALDLCKTPAQLFISVHLLTFYQQIGATLGIIAFFTALARCFDVLSDPIMASISDSFSSRFGRRRPFIFFGSVLYGGCLLALCYPPEAVSVGMWFGLFYILFFLTDTLMSIPHNALGQELTSDADQRRKVFMIAKVFEAFGMIVASVAPVLLGRVFNGTCKLPPGCDNSSADEECLQRLLVCDDEESRRSMMVVGFAFGSYTLLAGGLCVLSISEKQRASNEDAGTSGDDRRTGVVHPAPTGSVHNAARSDGGVALLQEHSGANQATKLDEVLPGFLCMLRNKPFLAMILPWILDKTIVAMLSSLLPFYVMYVIAPELICFNNIPPIPEVSFQCSSRNLLGIGLVSLLIAAILSMPVWQALAKRFGDYKVWLAFNFLNAATTILFITGESSTKSIFFTIGFAVLNGLPIGASFLTDNILGLVIDYDELRTGKRTEATFTMFASFIPKVVSIPASAFPLTILAIIGFREPSGGQIREQDDAVQWGIRVMFSAVPTFLAMLSFVLKATQFPFKDLRRADAEIKAALILRKAGEPYQDPLNGSFRHHKIAVIGQSEHLRAETLLAHFTGCLIPERMQREGTAFLVRKTVLQLLVMIAAFVAFAASTVISMRLGFLNNPKMSWLPSLCVLLTGAAVLASLVACLRLRAAVLLRTLVRSLPPEFLDNECTRRREFAKDELPTDALDKIDEFTEGALDILCGNESRH